MANYSPELLTHFSRLLTSHCKRYNVRFHPMDRQEVLDLCLDHSPEDIDKAFKVSSTRLKYAIAQWNKERSENRPRQFEEHEAEELQAKTQTPSELPKVYYRLAGNVNRIRLAFYLSSGMSKSEAVKAMKKRKGAMLEECKAMADDFELFNPARSAPLTRFVQEAYRADRIKHQPRTTEEERSTIGNR